MQTRATALEVAQAAWALHERVWHDLHCHPTKKQFRADLFKECPELQWMQDYAEAGKHVGLGREGVQLVSITGAENPGGVLEITAPLGTLITTPECTLMINAGGKSYKLVLLSSGQKNLGDQLILKRASASRSSGEWKDDDFDVLADGTVVGRIMKAAAAPEGTPWLFD
jgi:hypothetical protein